MSDENVAPFARLRQKVRHSGQQYCQNKDNKSIFGTDQGYVFAYDVGQVEAALDEFESSLPAGQRSGEGRPLSMAEQLVQKGRQIVATSDDRATRDFARAVVAHLINQAKEDADNPLRLLRTDLLKGSDE